MSRLKVITKCDDVSRVPFISYLCFIYFVHLFLSETIARPQSTNVTQAPLTYFQMPRARSPNLDWSDDKFDVCDCTKQTHLNSSYQLFSLCVNYSSSPIWIFMFELLQVKHKIQGWICCSIVAVLSIIHTVLLQNISYCRFCTCLHWGQRKASRPKACWLPWEVSL